MAIVFVSTFAQAQFSTRPERYNCQYQSKEKVQLQINLLPGHNYLLIKSASMNKAAMADILDFWDSSWAKVMTGYLPAPWAEGTSFRIRFEQGYNFQEILINNPDNTFFRTDMMCSNG